MDLALLLAFAVTAAVDRDQVLIVATTSATPDVVASASASASAPTLDRVRLADGAEVVGRVSIGALRVVGACGALDLDGADVAGIGRDGGALALVSLSDGGRVQGFIERGRIQVTVVAGVVASFPLGDVVELALAAPATAPTHDGPWLCVGATRLRARWTADAVTMRCAVGTLTVPTRVIAAVLPPSVEHPLGAVALTDGSSLLGLVERLPALALASDIAPSSDWGLDAGIAQPALEAACLRLAGGDLLIGELGAIRLATAHGEHRLPAGSVRRLTPHPRDERVFAVELIGGGKLEGRLAGGEVEVTADWATLSIPTALVRAYE